MNSNQASNWKAFCRANRESKKNSRCLHKKTQIFYFSCTNVLNHYFHGFNCRLCRSSSKSHSTLRESDDETYKLFYICFGSCVQDTKFMHQFPPCHHVRNQPISRLSHQPGTFNFLQVPSSNNGLSGRSREHQSTVELAQQGNAVDPFENESCGVPGPGGAG
jgi:hypothetical protein